MRPQDAHPILNPRARTVIVVAIHLSRGVRPAWRTYVHICVRASAVVRPQRWVVWCSSSGKHLPPRAGGLRSHLYVHLCSARYSSGFWILYVWFVRNATTLAPARRLRCPIRILWRLLVGLCALHRLAYSCPIGPCILLTCVAPKHIPQAHAEVRSRHWLLAPPTLSRVRPTTNASIPSPFVIHRQNLFLHLRLTLRSAIRPSTPLASQRYPSIYFSFAPPHRRSLDLWMRKTSEPDRLSRRRH